MCRARGRMVHSILESQQAEEPLRQGRLDGRHPAPPGAALELAARVGCAVEPRLPLHLSVLVCGMGSGARLRCQVRVEEMTVLPVGTRAAGGCSFGASSSGGAPNRHASAFSRVLLPAPLGPCSQDRWGRALRDSGRGQAWAAPPLRRRRSRPPSLRTMIAVSPGPTLPETPSSRRLLPLFGGQVRGRGGAGAASSRGGGGAVAPAVRRLARPGGQSAASAPSRWHPQAS